METPITLTVELSPTTAAALIQLSANAGVTFPAFVDRWLALAITVAADADKGRYLATVKPLDDGRRMDEGCWLAGVGSAPLDFAPSLPIKA